MGTRIRQKSGIRIIGLNLLLLFGCSNQTQKDFIGSAVIESQTFQIATTAQGQVAGIYKEEGNAVKAGELAALIDTLPYLFKLNQVLAAQAELRGSIAAKKGEIASQESDYTGLDREYKRAADLADKGSVPTQQKDNLSTQQQSAKLRIQANRLLLSSIEQKTKGLASQEAEVRDMLRRCRVLSPADGIILTRYKNQGEVVALGNPLYELGRFDTMQIDFFVPQPLLTSFKLGQSVRVRLDNSVSGGKENATFVPAVISWISNEAEFTPKNIQTRESRNELVFKIRAMAANKDEVLKRGLPVEIWR